MNRIAIIKKTTNPFIGHLYEHLYCIALNQQLIKHGFFNYTDYRIEARNYHVGFIYITALLYNPNILKKIDITSIMPSFLGKDIDLACSQICAENKVRITLDKAKIVADLELLHNQPWESLDAAAIHNLRHTTTQNMAITSPAAAKNFKNLACTITLNPDYALKNERALPLFRELSQAILYNLSDTLTDTYGYFGLSTDSTYDFTTTAESHTFRIHKDRALSTDQIASITKEYATKLLNDSFKQSFYNYLQMIADTRNYYYDDIDVFEATGIVVGDKAWESIIKEYPMDNILAKFTIIIKNDNDSISLKIK